MLEKFLVFIVWLSDQFSGPFVLAAVAILHFNLLTSVSLIYFINRLETHQAVRLGKLKKTVEVRKNILSKFVMNEINVIKNTKITLMEHTF